MRFTKMHGAGNDYIYVNGFVETVDDPADVARKVSDRHFGIGGDGLVLILPSRNADVRMRMFNADGGEAEMCGNALRCVGKYVYDRGINRNNPMRVETGRGILTLDLKVENNLVREVTINMGEPILDLPAIPVDVRGVVSAGPHLYRVEAPNAGTFEAVFVSMGNPHAIIYVDDPAAVDVARLGPVLEHHPAFPRRINVHWAHAQANGEVIMRTWERGSGSTLACGTGACAVCVAGVLTGRSARKILAHLPGGDLRLDWRADDNCVYMTGPAVEVFNGEWKP